MDKFIKGRKCSCCSNMLEHFDTYYIVAGGPYCKTSERTKAFKNWIAKYTTTDPHRRWSDGKPRIKCASCGESFVEAWSGQPMIQPISYQIISTKTGRPVPEPY